MDGLLPTLVILVLMAAVVLIFRRIVRRPRDVSAVDPPGLRTVATFAGSDADWYADDVPDGPLVGIRLFNALCDGLVAAGIEVSDRGVVQNAQRALCHLRPERFALVLEWLDGLWVAGVEWVPTSRAEARHQALTHEVFSPPESPELRELLLALHAWLGSQPKLSAIQWHRKEKWIEEDLSDPRPGPLNAEDRPAGGD